MWKENIKHRNEKKKKENAHRRRGKKNGRLIFLLFIGDKQEILKLIFNTIICLLKHNNVLC